MSKQPQSLFSKSIAWTLVIFWMGLIFWFSHQPADESANISLRVMSLGGQLLNHWQIAGAIGFVIIFNLFLIWLMTTAKGMYHRCQLSYQ